MIIIFGTRSTALDQQPTGRSCPACKQEQSLFLLPYQNYFHIFWIPFFPTSKDYYAACSHCGANFGGSKQMLDEQSAEQVKAPKWTFAGLILAAVLFGTMFIAGVVSK